MLNRRDFMKTTGFSALTLPTAAASATQIPIDIARLRADPNRDNPRVGKAFPITDFGAIGDGKTLNTEAIQKAIDDAATTDHGGRVLVPKGVFLTGHIQLKSNVELHLEAGSTLLGSTNIEDYQKTTRNWYALISGNRLENVAITGLGTINGQGRELALNIRDLHLTGKRISPKFNVRRSRANEAERPQLIEFFRSGNVRIYDVTLTNAAMWVQTYEQCRDLSIDNIRVDSDAYWNNDGLDILDSRNVRISNSFVNAADDAICLKSETSGLSNQKVVITNCVVRSSASGVKFGTSSKGGFQDISVDQIKVYDTYRSAIALECVDGGHLENVSVSNIYATNTGNAIFVRLGKRNKVGDVGTLKNVSIKNVDAQIPFARPDTNYELRGPALNEFFNPIPASITGIPGHPVENISLQNIRISYPGRANKGMAFIPVTRLDWVPERESKYPEFSMFGELPAWGLYARHAVGISLDNLTLSAREEDFRPALIFDDVEKLTLQNSLLSTKGSHSQVALRNVRIGTLKENNLGALAPGQVQKLEDCQDIQES